MMLLLLLLLSVLLCIVHSYTSNDGIARINRHKSLSTLSSTSSSSSTTTTSSSSSSSSVPPSSSSSSSIAPSSSSITSSPLISSSSSITSSALISSSSSPLISSSSSPSSLQDKQKKMMSRLTKVSISTLIAGGSMLLNTNNKLCGICSNSLCKCSNILANAATIDYNNDWYNPINERIFDTTKKSYIPAHPEILQKELKGRNIITIGEVHNNPCHHRLEFEVIKSLSKTVSPSNLAIGLECFYRIHQNALDRFIFEHKDFAKLKKETNWQETWGYDLNMYAKIFQFACVHGIRIIGLNVPYEIAHLTSKVGYANLPPRLKELLPDMDFNVKKHKDQFYALIGGHGDNNMAALERMYETQTLWDEFMAESASNYIHLTKNDSYLVIIAGVGHVMGRHGIPDRIQKRTQRKSFVIVPQQVAWDKKTGLPDVDLPLTSNDCDWSWYTEVPIDERLIV